MKVVFLSIVHLRDFSVYVGVQAVRVVRHVIVLTFKGARQ